MKTIALASRNSAKIEATRRAFRKVIPNQDFSVESLEVHSDVRDQPLSEAETLDGAQNRARELAHAMPDADYCVGIEGGVDDDGQEMLSFAWVVVRSGTLSGKSRTATFVLPKQVAELVRQGKGLGEATEIVFGTHCSEQDEGVVGLLTGGLIGRTDLYVDSVESALRFVELRLASTRST